MAEVRFLFTFGEFEIMFSWGNDMSVDMVVAISKPTAHTG